MALITLTTDFGMRDPYVAAMKGVLRCLCPDAVIDDLSHDIAPQNILEAALFLEGAVPWYPANTIHLVVVDPGVGTLRRPVAVGADGHVFVAPDNGVLSLWLAEHSLDWAYQISPKALGNQAVSNTFHGRDIFAPAAARLACGHDPATLGEGVTDLQRIKIPEPEHTDDNRIAGAIIHIDRFGNCITNIRREKPSADVGCRVHIGDYAFPVHSTYGDVAPGTPLALYGSGNRLEIAVNQGNAALQFGFAHMASVILELPFPAGDRNAPLSQQ